MHALHPNIAEGEKRITTRERVQSGMRAKGNQEGHTIQHVQQRPVDQRSSVPVGESSLTPPQVSCLISYVGPEMFFFFFFFFFFFLWCLFVFSLKVAGWFDTWSKRVSCLHLKSMQLTASSNAVRNFFQGSFRSLSVNSFDQRAV